MGENAVRAKEMADLSIEQEVEESIQTLTALQNLFDENPSEEVAVELASVIENYQPNGD